MRAERDKEQFYEFAAKSTIIVIAIVLLGISYFNNHKGIKTGFYDSIEKSVKFPEALKTLSDIKYAKLGVDGEVDVYCLEALVSIGGQPRIVSNIVAIRNHKSLSLGSVIFGHRYLNISNTMFDRCDANFNNIETNSVWYSATFGGGEVGEIYMSLFKGKNAPFPIKRINYEEIIAYFDKKI